MTTEELRTFFKEHLVPGRLYEVGGDKKNRICLDQRNGGWDVYYNDKKNKVGIMHFLTEADACKEMKNQVRTVMEMMYGLTWATA